jgi:glycerophosphoryl diester phosphodiesterase
VRNAKKWLVRLALVAAVMVGLAAFCIRAIMGRVCTGANPPPGQKATLPFFEGLPRVLNIAHRGASKRAAEHSTEAYELGLRQGAHILELDLRSTRDRVLVVAHDRDLERTAGIQASLAELSWAELNDLAGARAPLRLDAVLTQFPAARFNLELKDAALDGARVLAQLLSDLGARDRVLVASAHREVLDEFRKVCQGAVPTSASTSEVLDYHFCYLLGQSCPTPFAALQLPPLDWLGLTRPEFIRHAQARGLVVHFWTIDDEARMRSLIDAGADGIMTNDPELLASVLGSAA